MDVPTMRMVAAAIGIPLGFIIGYFILFKPKRRPEE